jgi:protein-S-isoprenylcysteine O-methyltransferase Ste14
MPSLEPRGEEEPPRSPRPGGGVWKFHELVSLPAPIAFLCRYRTFLVLLGIVLMVPWAKPKPGMLVIGILIALAAEGWRIWAAGTIKKTAELTTGGPYAHIRHPLYFGSFLHAIAYSFMSGRWESFAFVLPLFALIYGAAMLVEERMLVRLFGEHYLAYCRRVPRLLPRLTPARPAYGSFEWRQVMANTEYVNVIWLIILSALFVLRL